MTDDDDYLNGWKTISKYLMGASGNVTPKDLFEIFEGQIYSDVAHKILHDMQRDHLIYINEDKLIFWIYNDIGRRDNG